MSDVGYVNGWADGDARPETGTAPGFSAVADIAVQHGAISGIAVSPDGGKAIVTHHGDDSFSLIDTGSLSVSQTVVGIDEPFAIAMPDPTAGRAYVSTVSAAYDAILAFDLDAHRVVATHPVAHSVTDLAVSPDGRCVYASRSAVHGADVAVIDTQTDTVDTIGLTAKPGTATECVRVSPDGRRLYVATNGPSGAALVVIDAHQKRVVSGVEIGSPIRDIALSPEGTTAYVASCGADFGAVLDVLNIRDTRASIVTNTYKIGQIGFLTQLTLSRDGERAYLVGDDSVTVLSTATCDVMGSIVVGAQPSCAIESPDGNRLYIGDYAGAVTVLTIESAGHDESTTAHEWALPQLPALELAGT